MLDPGKMVHWVTIQKATATTDVSGAATAWKPFLATWAQVDPIHGTDLLKSGQDTAQLFATIQVRWQPGILPGMRVQTKNRIYLIQAIENIGERDVVLVFTCLAVSNSQ